MHESAWPSPYTSPQLVRPSFEETEVAVAPIVIVVALVVLGALGALTICLAYGRSFVLDVDIRGLTAVVKCQ